MRRIADVKISSHRFPGQEATRLPHPDPETLFCLIVSADSVVGRAMHDDSHFGAQLQEV